MSTFNETATAEIQKQQHFLFDFVLQKADALSEAISEETVAITCEQRDRSPYRVPALDEIMKRIDKTAYGIDRNKLVSDIFECGAIAISNKVDLAQFDEREKRYLEIIRSYHPDEQKAIADIFGLTFALLSSMTYSNGGFDDYLGKLFMELKLGNDRNSQFFTPYHVSKMCAKMTLEEDLIREKAHKSEILTLNEPCCGAGGMALAAMDVLYNDYKFNYARNCLVVCEDIDLRCVHMCYLQLALSGVPAIVRHANTLTRECWSAWRTPAYMMQFSRFKFLKKISIYPTKTND